MLRRALARLRLRARADLTEEGGQQPEKWAENAQSKGGKRSKAARELVRVNAHLYEHGKPIVARDAGQLPPHFVQAADVAVYRGSLNNVLARFIGALDANPADHVVRLTADCPLADPDVLDAAIALHMDQNAAYTSNTPESFAFPKGLDVEVISASALRQAAAEASSPEDFEHVTWGIWTHPERWKIAWLKSPKADDGDIRWTVDTPDDYAFVAAVYDALYVTRSDFSTSDIRALVYARPDLARFGGHRRI